MNYSKRPMIAALALASASLAGGPAALAQDSALAIEEVVVTARKRAENLQEVPIAISAMRKLSAQLS